MVTVTLVVLQVTGSIATAILNHMEAVAAPICELATLTAGLAVAVWVVSWNLLKAVARVKDLTQEV